MAHDWPRHVVMGNHWFYQWRCTVDWAANDRFWVSFVSLRLFAWFLSRIPSNKQKEWTSFWFPTHFDYFLGKLFSPTQQKISDSALCCEKSHIRGWQTNHLWAPPMEPSIVPNQPSLGVLDLMHFSCVGALLLISTFQPSHHPGRFYYGRTILAPCIS